MSREIKFRAFHKQEQKMYPVWGTLLNAVYLASPGDLVNQRYFDNTLTCIDIAEVELMQYTGLTDKNDKEIWEGDIVRINHPHDMTGDFTNAVGDVFWWEEEGGWYHGNNNGRPPKRMWQYVEVIGNIYEQQDLLPEKS